LKTKKKLLCIGALVAMATGWSAAAGGSPASAGITTPTGTIEVYVDVVGDDDVDALELFDAISPELFNQQGTDVFPTDLCDPDPQYNGNAIRFRAAYSCYPTFDTYDLGLDGILPSGYVSTAECYDLLADAERAPERFVDPTVQALVSEATPLWRCSIRVAPAPNVYVDKLVFDESADPAEPGDFTLELYDDSGALVGTAVDTDPASCGDDDVTHCAVFERVMPGTYSLGETTVQGYGATIVGCRGRVMPTDRFPNASGEFVHGIDADTMCSIVNEPGTASIKVSKVVDNESGSASAGPADFTLELFDDQRQLVATGVCPADGVDCIATTLPNGRYYVGESGPDGYMTSVVCDITPGDDPVPPEQPDEIIDTPSAAFDVSLGGEADCTVTNVAAPSTSTTSTSTPTTAGPTEPSAPTSTIVSTTAFDAGSATLPATGTSSGTNRSIAVMALTLMGIGGAMVVVRRRQA
jgi:hypothetical protein